MDNVTVNVPTNSGRRGGRDKPKKKSGFGQIMRSKITAVIVGLVLIVSVLVFGGWTFYNSTMGASIDNSKYQAVFLTDGQVYFGNLHTLNGGYMKLTDVYYLQTKNDDPSKLQDGSGKSTSPGVELIKLGSEVHGPDDAMIINKDRILYLENLKSDGKVVTAITQYNNSKK